MPDLEDQGRARGLPGGRRRTGGLRAAMPASQQAASGGERRRRDQAGYQSPLPRHVGRLPKRGRLTMEKLLTSAADSTKPQTCNFGKFPTSEKG
jgi:hypothetical protein